MWPALDGSRSAWGASPGRRWTAQAKKLLLPQTALGALRIYWARRFCVRESRAEEKASAVQVPRLLFLFFFSCRLLVSFVVFELFLFQLLLIQLGDGIGEPCGFQFAATSGGTALPFSRSGISCDFRPAALSQP